MVKTGIISFSLFTLYIYIFIFLLLCDVKNQMIAFCECLKPKPNGPSVQSHCRNLTVIHVHDADCDCGKISDFVCFASVDGACDAA